MPKFGKGNGNVQKTKDQLYQKLVYSMEFRLKTLNKLFLGGNFE